ncbi:MAG TPA: flagellar hook-associated protein FlgL [Candidatus Bathyarchaeia archaeon]|nr:flagellar hook-associated protein FlgL [Candidatus Bathyarchaeia archaeon]
MRVTPSMMTAQVQRELQAALAAIAHQQDLLSAGTRILAPADDPGGAAQAVTIRSRQAINAQFQKNVTAATAVLSAGDSSLRAIADVVTQAKDAAVQGASDSNDALARQSIGASVDQLLETLVNLANSRTSTGTFVFGGQESTTAPYTVTRDAAGHITAVTPNARGIDGPTPTEVSEGVTVPTRVSGTAVFGASTDPTYAFDVLIHLRDDLNGQPHLSLQPDVSQAGAANASAYSGVGAPTDLQIGGPTGSAFIAPTVAGDDAASYSGNATSAIALAAKMNLETPSTGVTATATSARITYSAGTFASDVTLDGTAGHNLVINGTSILGAVTGQTAAERRDALVALINGQSAATGVVATAVPGSSAFALTAADGRNISLETDAIVTPASANSSFFGFTSGLTGTGAATAVVARGGVQLTAGSPITVAPASSSVLAGQMSGQGSTGIQASLDDLTSLLNRVVLPQVLVGSRLSWVGLLNDRLQSESLSQATDLSHVEDLDVAKAATDLTQLQTFYQAALASGANLIQMSLLDFLK